jgi:hypothetical protein
MKVTISKSGTMVVGETMIMGDLEQRARRCRWNLIVPLYPKPCLSCWIPLQKHKFQKRHPHVTGAEAECLYVTGT